MKTNLAFALIACLALITPQEREEADPIPDVVDRVKPAVVSIYSSRPLRPPFDLPERRFREQAMGSGVVVREDGLVLTNFHVIDRATELRVVLADRREFKAKVAGTDRRTDLALLRVDAKGLPTLPFGDSDKVRVGETVLALGNPLGVGQTVSKGIVSATGRANVGIVDYEDFLQTDAAINPGNSGGALVNLKGQLIGINTAIASRTGGFQGIGFAIPSNMAREVVALLDKHGRVNRGQMGVIVQDMTPQLARAIEGAPERGVIVTDVLEDSPAERAGLARGDIVLKLDGEEISSAAQIRNRVALRGGGTLVKLQVWRDAKTFELGIRLRREEDKVPEARERDEPSEEEGEGAASGLSGITVVPATRALLKRRGLPEDAGGVVVTSIDPRRVSAFSGLVEGDVIVEVNRTPVSGPQEMREAARKGRDTVLLTVRRPGGTVYLAVARE